VTVRKLLVCSQKGGVGKTTSAIALAGATALTGARVLLIDADPLSNIASALNLVDNPQRQRLREAGIDLPGVLVSNVVPGLDVLSPYDDGGCTDEDLDSLLALVATPSLQDHYGCLVLDTPPFLGPNPAQLVATCDEFIIVMRAEAMAYRTLPAFLELMQRARSSEDPIKMRGILLTLPEGEEPGGRWERELRGRLGTRILPQVVPHDDAVVQAALGHQIVTHSGPVGLVAQTYRALAETLELAHDHRETVERTSAVSALQLSLTQSKAMPRKPAAVMKPLSPSKQGALSRPSSLSNQGVVHRPPSPSSQGTAPRPAPISDLGTVNRPVSPSNQGADNRPGSPSKQGAGSRPTPAKQPRPTPRPAHRPVEAAAPLPPVAPSASRPQPAAPAESPAFPMWIAAVCVVVAVTLGIALRFAPLNILLPGLVGLSVAGVVLLLMRMSAVQDQLRAATASRPAPAPAPAPASPPPSEPRASRRLSGLKRRLKMASREPRNN
jgi:chromosome partitioning protein